MLIRHTSSKLCTYHVLYHLPARRNRIINATPNNATPNSHVQAEKGFKPRPANAEDAARVLELAKQLNDAAGDGKVELNEDVLRVLAHNSSSEINPMAAMFGECGMGMVVLA